MEKINFRNIEEYRKKDFALYNQLMINKAIEEGFIEFLPVKKISNKSIGEWIELKYNQLYDKEFDRYFHKDWLNDYDHLINKSPKITQKESLLYIREIILHAIDTGNIDNIEKILESKKIEKDTYMTLFQQDRKLSKKINMIKSYNNFRKRKIERR